MTTVVYRDAEERSSCEFATDVVITLSPDDAAILACILGRLKGNISVLEDIYDGLIGLNEDITYSDIYETTGNQISRGEICF